MGQKCNKRGKYSLTAFRKMLSSRGPWLKPVLLLPADWWLLPIFPEAESQPSHLSPWSWQPSSHLRSGPAVRMEMRIKRTFLWGKRKSQTKTCFGILKGLCCTCCHSIMQLHHHTRAFVLLHSLFSVSLRIFWGRRCRLVVKIICVLKNEERSLSDLKTV